MRLCTLFNDPGALLETTHFRLISLAAIKQIMQPKSHQIFPLPWVEFIFFWVNFFKRIFAALLRDLCRNIKMEVLLAFLLQFVPPKCALSGLLISPNSLAAKESVNPGEFREKPLPGVT